MPSLAPFFFFSLLLDTSLLQYSLLSLQKVTSPQNKGRTSSWKSWGDSFPFSKRKNLQHAGPSEDVIGSFGR